MIESALCGVHMANMLDLLEGLPSWQWPENARDALQHALKSGSAEDRRRAADLAGDIVVMDDSLAEILLGILERDDDGQLRAAAAIAFGPALEDGDMIGFDEPLDEEFDDRVLSEGCFQRVRDTLERVYSDQTEPANVRRACLEAAIRAPEDWQNRAVQQALDSSDRDWRITGVFCAGFIPGFDTPVLEALNTEDPDLLREAARAAGQREIEAAAPRLVELAADEKRDKELRLGAIQALAYVRGDQVSETLSDLSTESDRDIAEASSNALTERQALGIDADIDDDFEDEDDEEDDHDDEN